jgi:hypothetical protein
MNEQNLRKALLSVENTTAPTSQEAQATAQRIVARDQYRFLWLVRGTLALWVMTVLALFFVLWWCSSVVLPRVEEFNSGLIGHHPENPATNLPPIAVEATVDIYRAFIRIYRFTIWMFAVCVGLIGLAAASTIWLVLHSRAATLRQINTSLTRISEDVLKLGAGSPGPQRIASDPPESRAQG